MKQLLLDAIALKNNLHQRTIFIPPETVMQIEERIRQLLLYDYSTSHNKIKAFIKRLIKTDIAFSLFCTTQRYPLTITVQIRPSEM